MYWCESIFTYDACDHSFANIDEFIRFIHDEWEGAEEFFENRVENWFITGRIIKKESVFNHEEIIFHTCFDSEESCDAYMNEAATLKLVEFFTSERITLQTRNVRL